MPALAQAKPRLPLGGGRHRADFSGPDKVIPEVRGADNPQAHKRLFEGDPHERTTRLLPPSGSRPV